MQTNANERLVMGLGTSTAPPSRCVLVWSALTGAAALLLHLLLPSVVAGSFAGSFAGSWAGPTFEAALVRCCSLVGVAVTGWIWVTASLLTLDAARGRAVGRRGVPVAVRRVVLAACGVALTSGVLTPALAGTGTGPVDTPHTPGAEVLRGLRLPERVGVRAAPHPAPASTGPAAVLTPVDPHREVVVAPDDTLWSIAAARLGPAVGDRQIATYWPRLYDANVDVVGADPDLIEPGQRLVLPPVSGADGGPR